jgi:hypothetical protein
MNSQPQLRPEWLDDADALEWAQRIRGDKQPSKNE